MFIKLLCANYSVLLAYKKEKVLRFTCKYPAFGICSFMCLCLFLEVASCETENKGDRLKSCRVNVAEVKYALSAVDA